MAPLLRRPDNRVHLETAIKYLTRAHREPELIIMYEEKEMHVEGNYTRIKVL